MLKIGLTGGIGSGKTAVAAIFQVLGIPVFYADSEARVIMEKDQLLIASIRKEFGEKSYINFRLNRSYISQIVFNDPYRLERLNALVHPATIAAADKWMQEQTSPYVVKEAALMFEAGSAAHLDYITGVFAPEELRIKRVMDRDKVDRDQVLMRINRQIDEDLKMKLCDFVVINDEQQLLMPQVLKLHGHFLQIAVERSK